MKKPFKLRPKAEQDLWNIYEWGRDNFGENQALNYQLELFKYFDLIVENPAMFAKVDEYYPGLRRCSLSTHAIYYLEASNGIDIIRILGRQDLTKAFK